jgi:hypothetical protein
MIQEPTEPFLSGDQALLEIPTPHWVVYDKVSLGAESPEEAELIGQERAYTSPIWYGPGPDPPRTGSPSPPEPSSG